MSEPANCKCVCHAPKEETKPTCPPHKFKDSYYNVVNGVRETVTQKCFYCPLFQTVPYTSEQKDTGLRVYLNNNDRNPN